MDYPVFEGTEQIGTLTVRREGLYAVFSASLPLLEGLQRLWLCGERKSVCLGVLTPRQGMLRLEKRLSRAACAKLPSPLLCASLSPERPSPAPAPAVTPAQGTGGTRELRLFGQRFIVYRS